MIVVPFGECVLSWRMERGLTQNDLACAAGITRPNLSAIERGQREVTLSTLRSLAVALGVRPGVLADGVSPWGPPRPLSRRRLERVAHAVATATALEDRRDHAIAECLGQVVGPSNDRRVRTRPSDRASDLAYLKLKAMVGPEAMASLLSRTSARTPPPPESGRSA